jgi:ATPase subunit of ABC transporter with duplicated ATPase domains
VAYSKLINEFEEKNGYTFIQRIEKILDLLGFSSDIRNRPVNTLSGGEKRLLKLATGFIRECDLYLLDEPTNHLDDTGIHYLIKALQSTPAAFIVVSHDRWFLDQTIEKNLEIEQRAIKDYTGNYSIFHQTKQTEIKTKLRKKEKIETEISKLKSMERKYRTWSKRKEKQKNVRYRRDGDKKSVDKGNISHKAAKLMKRSIQAKDRINKKISDLEQSKPYIERWYDFQFDRVKTHRGSCMSANMLAKSYGEKRLFENLSFTVDWGEKVALTGPNGSGKTTLLNMLLKKEKPDSGEVIWKSLTRIHYLAQQWNPAQDNRIIAQLFSKERHNRARTMIGVLKIMVHGNVLGKKLGELSQGQKRKIKIVELILSAPNVIILDEPTTHLDYQTVEIMEKALDNFNGTIILVSHDRFLRERVTTREICLGKNP